MFDFLVRKGIVSGAQNFIDRLSPKVEIHIHPEAPLPSIGLVKKLSVRASEICALEAKIKALSDQELKAAWVHLCALKRARKRGGDALQRNEIVPATDAHLAVFHHDAGLDGEVAWLQICLQNQAEDGAARGVDSHLSVIGHQRAKCLCLRGAIGGRWIGWA